MRVLKVEPYQLPEVKEIDSGLSSLQHEVEGWIEATYPFEDPVAIICNEEGKLNGMEYNRAIRDENGIDGIHSTGVQVDLNLVDGVCSFR